MFYLYYIVFLKYSQYPNLFTMYYLLCTIYYVLFTFNFTSINFTSINFTLKYSNCFY